MLLRVKRVDAAAAEKCHMLIMYVCMCPYTRIYVCLCYTMDSRLQ